MGCPCNKVTTSTTTNCGSCGYNCTSCVCPPDPIVMPTVTCEDPNPCSELYPLQCVIYTGEDIKCSSEALMLYPNVIHFLVLEESSTTERNFVNILENINEQLCYIFSKDFITQLLTNIQNDEELSLLFCNIISDCNCECALTCPSVIDATYNSISDPSVDTITIDFNQVIGGSSITFSGGIVGTTLTVTTPPGVGSISVGMKITGSGVAPNTFITAGAGVSWTVSVSQSVVGPIVFTATKTTYTAAIYRLDTGNYYYVGNVSSAVWGSNIIFPSDTTGEAVVSVTSLYDNTGNKNWMVSVLAQDALNSECFSGFLVNNALEPIDYDVVSENCGVGLYTASTEESCRQACINESNTPTFTVNGDGTLNFAFTTENIPVGFYPITSYTVHWYKEDPAGIYTAQYGWEYVHTGTYGSTPTILTTTLTGTDYNFNYLILILAETGHNDCYSGLSPRLPLNDDGTFGTPYTEREIKNLDCNKFIYTAELIPPFTNP